MPSTILATTKQVSTAPGASATENISSLICPTLDQAKTIENTQRQEPKEISLPQPAHCVPSAIPGARSVEYAVAPGSPQIQLVHIRQLHWTGKSCIAAADLAFGEQITEAKRQEAKQREALQR